MNPTGWRAGPSRRRIGLLIAGLMLLLLLPVPLASPSRGLAGNARRRAVVRADVPAATIAAAEPLFVPLVYNAFWIPECREKIAFQSTHRDPAAPADSDIYLINPDGTGLMNLTNCPSQDMAPAWSPDGKKIAFSSDRLTSGWFQLYVMNADGTGVVKLTRSTSYEQKHPTWSPDGTKLAYMAKLSGFGAYAISIAQADGTRIGSLQPWLLGECYEPTWSPDGSQIAFGSFEGEGNTGELYVMNAADVNKSTEATRLTENDTHEYGPQWSPDGTQIVFWSVREQGTALYVMNADGSGERRLTDGSHVDSAPSWSPDGTQIVFRRDDGLCVMNADGSDQTPIPDDALAALDDEPSWGTPCID